MKYIDTERNYFCKECGDITVMVLYFTEGIKIPVCRDCIFELFSDKEVLMAIGVDEVYETIKDEISTYEKQ